MRLALITPGFASPGEANFAIPALMDTVRWLASRHDVHVFTLRYPHHPGRYTIDNATVHAFGWGTAGGLSRVHLIQQALAAVRREHRRRPFDLFHGLWADEPGFLAVAAGRLLGRPSVVSILGGELVGLHDIGYGGQLSRINRLLTRQALRHADRVTVGSATLRALAQASVAAARLVTLPLGVDTALFTPTPLSPFPLPPSPFYLPPPLRSAHFAGAPGCYATAELRATFHLLHVASLTPVKDQATLLNALAIVAKPRPDVHLHVAGDGPLRGALAAQVEALSLAAHVTLHGDVPHERLPDFYRAANLFVLSSRYESQSLVALEAGACGCPVVGTAVGLLPELLAPAGCGQEQASCGAIVAPVGDHVALAQAILHLIRQPDALAEAGRSLQRRVVADFSLDSAVERQVSLYQELL